MKIGLDLDNTVYGYPEFFREFIPAMVARGHKFYCTSGHCRETFEEKDRDRLRSLGIDPDLISPELLVPRERKRKFASCRNGRVKQRYANHCDVVFDDNGLSWHKGTRTPIFITPKLRAADRR